MRQIVLDTETTGLDPQQGHKVIEIGCVEIIDRKLTGAYYQCYLDPERDIDVGAEEVHGISREFLTGKPRFYQIESDFLSFIEGAELIIHNAPFDVGFLDSELAQTSSLITSIKGRCEVLDSLVMAKQKHPGQRNSLDALCRRYAVDNTQRTLHGALLDAEILADVYLLMTSGQRNLELVTESVGGIIPSGIMKSELVGLGSPLIVVRASEDEEAAHFESLAVINEKSTAGCLWMSLDRKNK
jgi:DNA polymerase-3 subunit epsilon